MKSSGCNLYGQKSTLENVCSEEQLFIYHYINMFALFRTSLPYVGQPHYLKEWTPSTPEQF
jgi:hypothetical protein